MTQARQAPAGHPDATGGPVVFTSCTAISTLPLHRREAHCRWSLTRDGAYARLKSTLSAFNKDPRDAGVFAGAVIDEDVLAFRRTLLSAL